MAGRPPPPTPPDVIGGGDAIVVGVEVAGESVDSVVVVGLGVTVAVVVSGGDGVRIRRATGLVSARVVVGAAAAAA